MEHNKCQLNLDGEVVVFDLELKPWACPSHKFRHMILWSVSHTPLFDLLQLKSEAIHTALWSTPSDVAKGTSTSLTPVQGWLRHSRWVSGSVKAVSSPPDV